MMFQLLETKTHFNVIVFFARLNEEKKRKRIRAKEKWSKREWYVGIHVPRTNRSGH